MCNFPAFPSSFILRLHFKVCLYPSIFSRRRVTLSGKAGAASFHRFPRVYTYVRRHIQRISPRVSLSILRSRAKILHKLAKRRISSSLPRLHFPPPPCKTQQSGSQEGSSAAFERERKAPEFSRISREAASLRRIRYDDDSAGKRNLPDFPLRVGLSLDCFFLQFSSLERVFLKSLSFKISMLFVLLPPHILFL